jgi:uncharacterized membrane protein YecN with MAPEG domain
VSVAITGLYAALAALLILALGLNVSLQRRAHGIGLGSGPNGEIVRAVRAHANAVEYVPLALVLLLLLELGGWSAAVLHALGLALIVGRLAHAQGLLVRGGWVSPGRFLGTLATWTVIASAAVMLVWSFWQAP